MARAVGTVGAARIVPFAAYSTLFCIVAVAFQLMAGAYRSDHSQTGDEASHFVTSLMLHDYLRMHLGENFLRYAKDYYAHFPRVGLGHWPPMFEIAQALVFFLRRSGGAALAFQAVVSGVFAGWPAAVVARRYGLLVGLGAGLVLICAPIPLFLADTMMADNFLGVLVFASAFAWEKLYERRTIGWCFVFFFVACAAILTKGTAIALGLLPLFHALIKRDWALLREPKVLACGFAIALVTAPWYVFTYKLAASGFNYSWGWSFTRLALVAYPGMAFAGIGVPVIAGFFIGTAREIAKPVDAAADGTTSYLAAALAMLVATVVMPADIAPRYLIPAYPSIIVVAISGLTVAISWLAQQYRVLQPFRIPALLMLLAIGVVTTFAAPHVEPFGSEQIVSAVAAARSPNSLVLVSGSPRFEGAAIAAFAAQETVPIHYVVRGSKVLASGNFMGTNYKGRFATPELMRDWLVRNEIGFIAICEDREAARFSHNAMLEALIAANAGLFHPIAHIRAPGGLTAVYQLPAARIEPSRNDPVFAEIQLGRTP